MAVEAEKTPTVHTGAVLPLGSARLHQKKKKKGKRKETQLMKNENIREEEIVLMLCRTF